MTSTTRRAAVCVALFLVMPLVACVPPPGGGASGGPGADGPLKAKVLDFQADGFARSHGGAISDEPIDPEAVFGRSGETPEPVGKGKSYVAVSWYSGCHLATGAELWGRGDDLQVRFAVDRPSDPRDEVMCIRPFEPYVQFAVDSKALEGVRTVQGQLPVSPTPPLAELELSLTPLRPLPGRSSTDGDPDTVTLTCTPDGGTHPTPVAACESLRAVGGDFERLPRTGDACDLIYHPHVARATGSWQSSPRGPTHRVRYVETFDNPCFAAVATDNVFDF